MAQQNNALKQDDIYRLIMGISQKLGDYWQFSVKLRRITRRHVSSPIHSWKVRSILLHRTEADSQTTGNKWTLFLWVNHPFVLWNVILWRVNEVYLCLCLHSWFKLSIGNSQKILMNEISFIKFGSIFLRKY